MKLKKIVISKFNYSDEFGNHIFRDVEVLIDPSENDVNSKTFDQNKHEFLLSSLEIERLSRASAQMFYDKNIKNVISGVKPLTASEINGIKNMLKLSGVELGTLIGLEKSSVSRLLSGKQAPQKDKMILLLERVREELEHPGKARITLSSLDSKARKKNVEKLNIPAIKVAEFFIRRFSTTDGPITNLKLQKLLYYAQGIGYGRSDVKLIKEPIAALDHGPVVREVLDVYSKNGSKPLPINKNINLSEVMDNELVLNILEETISLYGVYDAWYLRDKTHNEMPWASTERYKTISEDLMISFFKGILV